MSTSAADIQRIARRAGVDLPEERAQMLVAALAGIDDAARLLSAIEYGETEPAARFRPPAGESK